MAESSEGLRRGHRRQRFAVDEDAVVVENHEFPRPVVHPVDATSDLGSVSPGPVLLRRPYTSGMGTEDELKRCGQAAAALMGVAAARAKQVAEQLLGSRENAKEDAKHRAETLVDEGRRAAADVVNALRKEASVLFRDLEHLEEHLRGGKGSATAPTSAEGTPGASVPPPRPAATAKAAATAAAAAGRKRAAGAKTPAATRPAATRPAATRPDARATAARTPAARVAAPKSAAPVKAAGRKGEAPGKVVGGSKKAAPAKAPAARKADGAGKGGTGRGASSRGRA